MQSLRTAVIMGLLAMFATVPSFAEDGIEATIDHALRDGDLPGYSVAVVKSGTIATVQTGGKVRNDADQPIENDTPFQIGSVSKSFTALSIMKLHEAGKVDLDAPIATYLEEFAGNQAGQITLRQALSHTSGYSTLQGNYTQTDLAMDGKALERRVRGVAHLKPALAPEKEYEYSNANYQIAGRIIEVISGQSYAAYVRENILQPLGMDNSHVIDGQPVPGNAAGHRPWFGTHLALDRSLTGVGSAPQGGIVTTAEDLAKYAIEMMSGEDGIITASGKKAMMSPGNDTVEFYGLGWTFHDELGLVWHNGANPGFQAQILMRPKTKDAFIYLTNGGSGFGFGLTSNIGFNLAVDVLELDTSKAGSHFWLKVVFVVLALLPFALLAGMVWSWRRRQSFRQQSAKRRWTSAGFGAVVATVIAWVLLQYLPARFDVPIDALALFFPDWGLLLRAVAYTALTWAALRLFLAATPRLARA